MVSKRIFRGLRTFYLPGFNRGILFGTRTEFQSHCRRYSLLRLAKHFHVDRHGFVRGGRQQREEVAGGFAGFGVEG